MSYLLDNSELNLVYSSRLFDTNYTSAEQDALSMLWPALVASGKYNNYSPTFPVMPAMPVGWDAFSAGTSDINVVVDTTTPTVSSTQIVWGDPITTGLVINWSPDGTYSSLDELRLAVQNGIENGTFDSIAAYLDGVTLFTATFTNSQITLNVGEVELQIDGAWLIGFQDLIDFSTALEQFGFLIGEALLGNLDSYTDEVASVTAILNQYSFDALRLISSGDTLFSITQTDTLQTLQIADLVITTEGTWNTDLVDLLTLADTVHNIQVLGDALAAGTLDQYADVRADVVSVLSAYSFDSLSVTLEGEQIIEYSVSSTEIQFNLLGATLTLSGTFPTDNVGQLFDLLLDVAVISETTPITSFDQIDGFDIDQIEIRDDQGSLVVGGYIPDEFGSLNKAAAALIQGTESSESLDADWVPYASNRVFDLLGGDDKVTLYQSSELWALEGLTDWFMSGDSSNGHGFLYFQNPQFVVADPIQILGGAGEDELDIRVSEYGGDYDYVTEFTADLQAGTLIGKNTAVGSDLTIFDVSFDSVETLTLQSGQQIDVTGSSGDDNLRLVASTVSTWDSSWVPTYLSTSMVFEGGAGADTFIFRKEDAVSPVVDVQNFFTSNYQVSVQGPNDYLFASETYGSEIRLSDVEYMVFETLDAQQTVLVSDLAGLTPYNGGVSISGTPTDGQRLAVDTSAIRDLDGVGELTIDWYRDYVLEGNGEYYDLRADDINTSIMVEVIYTDGAGNEEVLSDVVTERVAAFDRGDASTYITETLHLANETEAQINHGTIEIVTADETIEVDNYYWGTDLPKTSLASNETFSMRVTADLSSSVEISDVISQLRHIVGLSELSGLNAVAADADYDGSVGISDVIQNLRTIVGLSTPDKAKVFDAQGNDTFTLDSLNSTLYVVAPGDVDLSWVPADLV